MPPHRLRRRAALGLCLLLSTLILEGAASARPPATPTPAPLSPPVAALWERAAARTREIAARLDGFLAVSVRDLNEGRGFSLHGDTVVAAASTIKLGVLLTLLQHSERGLLRLGDVTTIRRTAMAGDDGLLSQLGDGTTTMALHDLMAAMILLSDNTATNLLLDRLGLPAVNEVLRSVGLTQTVLRRRMLDRAAALRGLENTTTSDEMLRLLVLVHSGQGAPAATPVLSAASTRAFLALLRVPNKVGALLPRGLPPAVQVPVLNKPGALEGVRADCGVVELPGRPYALCVYATLLGDEAAGEEAIAAVSRAWFAVFQRLASASPHGRLLHP